MASSAFRPEHDLFFLCLARCRMDGIHTLFGSGQQNIAPNISMYT
uniref:Uncharacterized protein n=1 Tax=Globisporangium ultimum (strain ATCC 200006 / CBS 805.95 / DAOM BR144) TaxID=431595 RepID=K3W6B8_GLOUD